MTRILATNLSFSGLHFSTGFCLILPSLYTDIRVPLANALSLSLASTSVLPVIHSNSLGFSQPSSTSTTTRFSHNT
ncbi:hypothetical protein BDW22DRAFT_1351444, partial [Trametopsis cervina]